MRIELKINKRQAMSMAEKLWLSNFFIYGSGNYNLTQDETSELIMKIFNDSPQKVLDFYKLTSSKRGL